MCMSCQLISTWIIKKRDNAVGHFYNQKKNPPKNRKPNTTTLYQHDLGANIPFNSYHPFRKWIPSPTMPRVTVF